MLYFWHNRAKEMMKMTKVAPKQRLYRMDHFKLLAAYFVIFIHSLFPGNYGIAVKTIARFAVPFFFLCSGFFLYGNKPENIIKKALHILKLFLMAAVVYFVATVLLYVLQRDFQGLSDYLHTLIKPSILMRFILFNECAVAGHLWYMAALLYVYIIYYFVEKLKIPDLITAISAIVLLAIHLVLWHILLTYKITETTFFVRNFLFIGFPFVTIGRMMKKHLDQLPRLNLVTVLLLLIVGSVCSLVSRFVFGNKSVPFGAIVCAITLLLVCVTGKQPQKPRLINAGIYSTYIYLFHPLVITVYSSVFSAFGFIDRPFPYLEPFVICILATAIAVVCAKLQKKS